MASDSKYGRPRGGRDRLPGPGSASVPQMDGASLGFSGMCGLVYSLSLSLCRKLLVSGLTRRGGSKLGVCTPPRTLVQIHPRSNICFSPLSCRVLGSGLVPDGPVVAPAGTFATEERRGQKCPQFLAPPHQRRRLLSWICLGEKKAPGCFSPAVLGPGCGFPGSADILMDPGKTPG